MRLTERFPEVVPLRVFRTRRRQRWALRGPESLGSEKIERVRDLEVEVRPRDAPPSSPQTVR
jgi:hypothetical protein